MKKQQFNYKIIQLLYKINTYNMDKFTFLDKIAYFYEMFSLLKKAFYAYFLTFMRSNQG